MPEVRSEKAKELECDYGGIAQKRCFRGDGTVLNPNRVDGGYMNLYMYFLKITELHTLKKKGQFYYINFLNNKKDSALN